MGKKGGWFIAAKKALNPQSKKEQRTKSKKKWDEHNKKSLDNTTVAIEQLWDVNANDSDNDNDNDNNNFPTFPQQPCLETNSVEVSIEDDQNKDASSVVTVATIATTKADDIAATQVAPTQVAAAEIVRLTTATPYLVDKSKEEIAAVKIQTAFRGYLGKRELKLLRGEVRLKSLIESQSVKRQSTTTLRCMQTLARVQSQVRARRIRMSEENHALQRHLKHRHQKENEKLKIGGTWDDSTRSKEQIEAELQSKHEAAIRRERALAYAFTHQQARKNKNYNPTFMDPNNPQWGWSWLERWMATRPWDDSAMKRYRTLSVVGEMNRAYALADFNFNNNNDKNKPSSITRQSSSRRSPPSHIRAQSLTQESRKSRFGSPKAQGRDTTNGVKRMGLETMRRHSTSGASLRMDHANSQSVSGHTTPTRSKSSMMKRHVSDQRSPFTQSSKKHMSCCASPNVPRRHSVPGKFESPQPKDVSVQIFVKN